MIERVRKDFIPVAVKAARVEQPPAGEEGRIYGELKRTRPAPQGVAVLNASGNVLAWSLMFEGEDSVLGFLDHVVDRYRESPDASSAPVAERFHRFPGHRLPDLPAAETFSSRFPEAHPEGEACSGGVISIQGVLAGRVVGRALDEAGDPIEQNVRSQDTYIEDRLELSRAAQEAFLGAVNGAEPGTSFPIPAVFSREIVASAYLGMLDVSPLGGRQTGGEVVEESLRLRARIDPGESEGGVVAIELWGDSLAAGKAMAADPNRGVRDWENRVRLSWVGRARIERDSLVGLVLLGEGEARLRWNHGADSSHEEVVHLPSGKRIDFSGAVRFGVSIP